MKVLLINAVCGIRSTGRICTDLADMYRKAGHEAIVAYGREEVPKQFEKNSVKIGNKYEVYWHALMSRLVDDRGLWSKKATREFVKWADEYNPDILWLHNLHSYYINYQILFEWIKSRPNMIVKWTQHDCWAFTGGCTHFSFIKCEKWKTECKECPLKNNYIMGQKCRNYQLKLKAFTGVKNMTIITPSRWLAGLVKDSFLNEYKVMVINNTIDKNVFKPTKSAFRELNKLQDKTIILGVASEWTPRKGLEDFISLSSMLSDEYKIVLVGLNTKQIKKLPSNIIGIKKTNSTEELAGLYTSADLFVNATYEDNYPTTNLEAQACGTPTITYNTGGSVESVPQRNICPQGDLNELKRMIVMRDYDEALILNNQFKSEYLF